MLMVLFACPVENCDSDSYRSQRGCRKHINQKHGWFFYFDSKPNIETVLPEHCTRNQPMQRTKRSNTKDIPMFLKSCLLHRTFKKWLESPGGGSKSSVQAEQIACRISKYLKYCCQDVTKEWEIPEQVIDYCLGSVTLISDFVTYLQEKWKVGYAGIIGYINSLSHLLDFRRVTVVVNSNTSVFIAAEIYMDRVKKCLSKKNESRMEFFIKH